MNQLTMTQKKDTKQTIYFLIILSYVLVGSIIYSNSLNAPFYFDDFQNILAPSLKMEELSLDAIHKAISQGSLKKRLVANFSFALNYYLHGAKVQGYHVVNIAIHIINSILLFFFIRMTLMLSPNKEQYKNILLLPYATSLIWLTHPLATQSVTYLVQRMNSLVFLFYLLTLISYVQTRLLQKKNSKKVSYIIAGYLLCTLSGLLALGSKEISVTIPVMLLLYEIFFFRNLELQFNRRNIFLIGTVIILLVTVVVYFLGPAPWVYVINDCKARYFTMSERLLTQFRVIIHYITLIFYPAPERLIFDYTFPVSRTFFQPITTLYSFLSLAGTIIFALLIAKKERLLSFCILCFFLTLVVESSVVCLEIIFEHRTYMPSAFLLLFCMAGLQRITGNLKAIPLIFLAVSILFGFWTFERNKTWQDPLVFWSDSVNKAPGKARSLNNLGNAFYYKNQIDQAIQSYNKALDFSPDFLASLKNIAIAYTRNEDYEKAKYYSNKALERKKDFVDVLYNLAIISMAENNIKMAEQYFQNALQIDSNFLFANINYGSLLLRSNRPSEALPYLKKAIKSKSKDTDLLLNLGEAYLLTGRIEEAQKIYQNTIEISPSSAPAHYNLAMIFSNTNKETDALYHYKEAVRLAPFYIPALYNYGNLLLRFGKKREATEQYLKIIEMRPELSNSYNNLGMIFAQNKQFPEASLLFQEALQVMPSNGQAEKNLQNVLKEKHLTKEGKKN